MTLHLAPVTLKQAARYVQALHRHNQAPVGGKWAVAVADDTGLVRGVAIIGRPVARHLDDGWTAEVTRTCTDGARNANSMLYGAAWRAARAMGFLRMVSYTQGTEDGRSLRAAGWLPVAELPEGPGWDRPSRPRALLGTEHTPRVRWEAPGSRSPGGVSSLSFPAVADDGSDLLSLFDTAADIEGVAS